jgi:hypothetical protein
MIITRAVSPRNQDDVLARRMSFIRTHLDSESPFRQKSAAVSSGAFSSLVEASVQTKLIAYPVILTITVLLTGCDAAETAANKVIETSKTQLAEAARDTFSESAKQISETIDKAQESVKPWMTDRDKAESQQSVAERENGTKSDG